jgi:hypothetical protein
MAEFKRTKFKSNEETQITRKTVFFGFMTIMLFLAVVMFGLPLLVKFSVLLGDIKNRGKVEKEVVMPPLPPRLVIPYEATNSAMITIVGLAEPKITVELLKNDVSIGKKEVSDKGDFSFEGITLEEGVNSFSTIAMTDKGGSSEASKSETVIFDNQSPEIQMINPLEDTLKVDYTDFDVIGKTEKGASVTINGRVAPVDNDGQFKLKTQLVAGKNEIEVRTVDTAGNETKKNIVITADI